VEWHGARVQRSCLGTLTLDVSSYHFAYVDIVFGD
jgi:hypothetical protein